MVSLNLSIEQTVRTLCTGEWKAIDLVELCLKRIERQESQLRAWVLVAAEEARSAARRLDELAASGRCAGPLHGIPIGVKDIVDIAGWPTRCGSPLRTNHVAAQDAVVSRRLKDAGAILLGKTVTTEFACFDPPPTRNPWNHQRTPGGSSSGSAAAVAAGMCMAAIGSQTGGSIVRPASFCGVAGFKPSKDRVSTFGVFPISGHLDHVGPLANSAADLRAVFNAIAEDVSDVAGRSKDFSSPKLMVIEEFFFAQAEPSVREVTRTAIERLKPRFGEIQTLALPASFAELHRMHKRLMAKDAADVHRENFVRQSSAFGRNVAALIEEGLKITSAEYDEALLHQKQFRSELVAAWPADVVALMPATVTTAPSLETTGDPRFNAPWSYSGFPSVTVPSGLAADGLPCGLQLVSAPGTDAALLAVAEAVESLLGFPRRNFEAA